VTVPPVTLCCRRHYKGRRPEEPECAFGGTNINQGCIPTKVFVYTADLAMQVAGQYDASPMPARG
jgi:hypothetical protein